MGDGVEVPAPDDPATALAAVVALRRHADLLERAAVARALEQGWTWAQVGQALGVTPQAAHKRLAPPRGPQAPEPRSRRTRSHRSQPRKDDQ